MTKSYDIVIIGGGIQGCGIAQAASAAGYRCLLLEKTAIAAGTSSRSSKLIHGGLRYLESFDFSLVAKSIKERELLVRNAPGLVHHVPFYIPVYKTTTRSAWKIFVGLSLYALLGRLRRHARFKRIPKNKWSELDNLSNKDLKAVFQYWDAQTDDVKLTRAVMHSAIKLGAELICPAEFKGAKYHTNKKIYDIEFISEGDTSSCTANFVVNAAGPWFTEVQDKVSPKVESPAIDLVGGTHVVVNHFAPSGVYYVESPTDQRAIFFMPWYGKTMIGTTERVYSDSPDDIAPTQDEIDYLLSIAKHYFPTMDLTIDRSFAGLRVLPGGNKSVFKRPREVVLSQHKELPAYLALIGGKLTSYRATAEEVMDEVQSYFDKNKLAKKIRVIETKDIKLKPTSD